MAERRKPTKFDFKWLRDFAEEHKVVIGSVETVELNQFDLRQAATSTNTPPIVQHARLGKYEKTGAFRADRNDNRGENRGNWRDPCCVCGDKERSDCSNRDRCERGHGNKLKPRDRARISFENLRSRGTFKVRRAPSNKQCGKFSQCQYKEIADPVPFATPFKEQVINPGTQHEVSVTWVISPENFYIQISSLRTEFLNMMHKIPEIYKGVKPYSGTIPVGASVLARYSSDQALYRASVISAQSPTKFIVQYVDFGNKEFVDLCDIWVLDKQLMKLPKMAVHCTLSGVAPKDGKWKADKDITTYFDAPRYQCTFQEIHEKSQYEVILWDNVADKLLKKQLAIPANHHSSDKLKAPLSNSRRASI